MVATGETGQLSVMDQYLFPNAFCGDLLLLYQIVEGSDR
jgi:hypothetical protein